MLPLSEAAAIRHGYSFRTSSGAVVRPHVSWCECELCEADRPARCPICFESAEFVGDPLTCDCKPCPECEHHECAAYKETF